MKDWSDVYTKAELKKRYLAYLPDLMKFAQKCGYALALHGSAERDLDLLAVPWVPNAMAPESLVMKLQEVMDAGHWSRSYWKEAAARDPKPHGRKAYIIPIATLADDFEGTSLGHPQRHAMIDLSIAPRMSEK